MWLWRNAVVPLPQREKKTLHYCTWSPPQAISTHFWKVKCLQSACGFVCFVDCLLQMLNFRLDFRYP